MSRGKRVTQGSRMVVALGGNAILRRGEDGTIHQQMEHAEQCMRHLAAIIRSGQPVVLTHGNGPIVGRIMIRNEALRDSIPPMPLFICDADSEGGIGFLLQLTLYNQLRKHGVTRPIVTLITQVVVNSTDPAFSHPSKPIGPYYPHDEARRLEKSEGWTFKAERDGGFRRVVPCPRPEKIIEAPVIRKLIDQGNVVIAAGGGGIPVKENPDGTLMGIDAVIDKDWASALLACEVNAETLIILMEEDRVYLDYGQRQQRGLHLVGTSEMRTHLDRGQFEPGSMEPKIRAALHFLGTCGQRAIICRAEDIRKALAGTSGTTILPGQRS